jgi:hypothetical protein
MYERNQPDILATLGQMVQLAHRRANYNQNEVKEKLREYVQTDRRFKGYDLDRLVDPLRNVDSRARSSTLAILGCCLAARNVH